MRGSYGIHLLHRRVVAERRRRQGAVGGLEGALVDAPHQPLAVERVDHRLAHLEVRRGHALRVHRPAPGHARLGRALDLEPRIGLQALDLMRRRQVDRVHLPGLQRGEAGAGVGNLAEGECGKVRRPLVEIGRAPVVVRVAGELHVLVLHPLDELERPGADRLAAELRPELLDGLGGDGREEDLAHHGEEGGLRLLEDDPDGRGVDHLALVVEAAEGDPGLAGFGLRIDHPVEAELHGLGIERRPVVELDAGLELEGPDESVRGGRPGLGERREDLAVGPQGYQRVEDVQHDEVADRLGGHVRVEDVDEARRVPESEVPAGDGLGRGAGGQDSQG